MSDDTPAKLVTRRIHAVLRRVRHVHAAAVDAAAVHYAAPAGRTTDAGATSEERGT